MSTGQWRAAVYGPGTGYLIGHIPGASSVCCGHGVEAAYIVHGEERLSEALTTLRLYEERLGRLAEAERLARTFYELWDKQVSVAKTEDVEAMQQLLAQLSSGGDPLRSVTQGGIGNNPEIGLLGEQP